MVTSSTIQFDAEIVAHLCVEYWKLAKAARKAVDRLPETESRRLEGQLNFSDRQLLVIVDNLGLKLIEFEGETFHSGLAVSADNVGDYSDDLELVITKTLEPTVVADMRVIRMGRVIVQPLANEKE
jgi:hypothetical protein